MLPLLYRLSLLALLLAITLPFLLAHHMLPIGTFHQEWLAGALGLVALLPLALERSPQASLAVPRTVVLPLALLVLAWTQLAAGWPVAFESIVLLSLYLAWAILLMFATCRLEAHFGTEGLAVAIARTLLLGALAVALTAALQRWVPAIGYPFIFRSEGIVFGNIAQTNSFADYLWLGIASALYLHGRGKLPWHLLLPAGAILAGFSLLSGSRSVYLYAIALSGWLLFWQWRQPATDRRRLAAALALLPAVLILQLLIEQVGSTSVASAQRIATQGSYDPVRLSLWRTAWDVFLEHPLLGAGFDSFSREVFERVERHPVGGIGIPEHTHNLAFELLAEFGILGFLPALAAGILWLVAFRRWRRETAPYLAFGLLLPLGIHSGLEYPLWHAHFLAIAVIALTLGDGARWSLPAAGRHRLAVAAIVLAGCITMIGLRADYVRLEQAANGRRGDGSEIPLAMQLADLAEVYSHSLWRKVAAIQLAAHMPLDGKDTAERLKIIEEALHYSPIRRGVYRHAALLAMDGQHERAMQRLRLAMLSYPDEIPAAERLFSDSAARTPDNAAALAPLLRQLRQRSF